MKAIIVTHSLNKGGAERVGVDIANGLSKLGWEIIIMTHHQNEISYKPSSNVKLIWFDTKSKSRLINTFNIFQQFKKTMNDEKPDVIIEILHVFPHELLMARHYSKWKCPIIITEHDSFERPKSAPMPKYLYYKKWHLDKCFDYVTVLTKADKKYIGNRLRNVEVMYNPLYLKPLSSVPQKDQMILAVGRLDAWHYKGFDLLIQAWNEICNKFPDWILKIIGSGRDDSINYLKNLIKNQSSVIIEPYREDIENEYRKAEIFCLSSRYEGWGLVMVEAMSQGCATIACNYKGRQAECITDRENGIICETENISDLTESLTLLITDQKLRKRIQKRSISSINKFCESNVITKWDKFLKHVISNYQKKN